MAMPSHYTPVRSSLVDRRKLIALQGFLEETYPLYSSEVADISDYVRAHFSGTRRVKKNIRLWKSAKMVK